MAKKDKKKKGRNPLGELFKKHGDVAVGIVIGLGGVAAKALEQNLPLPASLQGGPAAALASAGIGVGAGWLAKKAKFSAPYAGDLVKGAVAIATYQLVGPKLLPMLGFTESGKAHAQLMANAQALLEAAKTQVAQGASGQSGQTQPQGVGDAFILSRGGITTADRAPRDTAALAGVGDAYAAERPGFSGAPSNLRGPWGRSIYSRQ